MWYLLAAPVPMIAGFAAARACPMKPDSGSDVPFRPPAVVFRIVWPVLYVMMGLAWALALRNAGRRRPGLKALICTAHLLLTAVLCSWLYFYACEDKRDRALLVLLAAQAAGLVATIVGPGAAPRLLLLPLQLWLLFATLLNFYQVSSCATNPFSQVYQDVHAALASSAADDVGANADAVGLRARADSGA